MEYVARVKSQLLHLLVKPGILIIILYQIVNMDVKVEMKCNTYIRTYFQAQYPFYKRIGRLPDQSFKS
jgi:hypothetical protein